MRRLNLFNEQDKAGKTSFEIAQRDKHLDAPLLEMSKDMFELIVGLLPISARISLARANKHLFTRICHMEVLVRSGRPK